MNRAYKRDWARKARLDPEKRSRMNRSVREHENRKFNAEYRKKLVYETLSHYSGGSPRCACCLEKEIDFLTLDHPDGDGAKHRLNSKGNSRAGGWRFYLWLRQNGYPERPRLQVLCQNCNVASWIHGICPHQLKAWMETANPTIEVFFK